MTAWNYVPNKIATKKPYVRVVDDVEDVRTSKALLLRLAGIDVRTYDHDLVLCIPLLWKLARIFNLRGRDAPRT